MNVLLAKSRAACRDLSVYAFLLLAISLPGLLLPSAYTTSLMEAEIEFFAEDGEECLLNTAESRTRRRVRSEPSRPAHALLNTSDCRHTKVSYPVYSGTAHRLSNALLAPLRC
jgi:hypothetical protein